MEGYSAQGSEEDDERQGEAWRVLIQNVVSVDGTRQALSLGC
jgi:hypothetical protein